MKKAGIITASVLGVLLLAAWVIPTFFRDKIIARLQQEINNRVNAQVHFRPDGVSLSLLRHFPNLTIQFDTLSIVGHAPFNGDTLIGTRSLEATINLMSAVSGDRIRVKGLYLDQPRILVKVLPDGRANYDIYKVVESDEPQVADTSDAAFTVDIDEWSVQNGLIRYEDQTLPLTVRLAGVDHTGSGSLSAELTDMALKTRAEALTLAYDGTEYVSEKKIDSDMKLRADLEHGKYTFTDNRIRFNDLPLELNGSITTGTSAPADTSIGFDLTYRVPDNDFKNLLSVLPGIYSERFKDIRADGTVRFDGHVKGLYNGTQMPAFLLNAVVKNGRFRYPDLPSAVEGIGLDLQVSNTTDQLVNTVVNLKNLVARLGSHPIRGRVLLRGLKRSVVDADVAARLDLQDLTRLFPIDSLTLRGLYELNLKAKGTYDKAAGLFPVVNALMRLQNGYAKSLKFPEPLEGINALATVTNRTGRLTDSRIDIGDLRLKLAGDPFQAKGWIQNFADYTFDLAAKGRLDLTKLTRIFPVEGTRLAGLIDADIQAKGRLSDAKAKRYERLPTSGTLAVRNLKYEGEALPQGLTLASANMNMAPGKLTIRQAEGTLGSSRFTADGSLTNYIPFLLEDDQPLEGTMNVRANRLNVNEWMTDEPSAPKTGSPSVVEIPRNIRFTLNTTLGQALYDEMPLNDIRGQVEVADGAVRMKSVTFNSLGGRFITNGLYDSKDIRRPRFAFDVDIANADVNQAYKHLTLAKIVFPLAQYVFGKFSSKFNVDGRLEPNMMPDLNSLTGNALVKVVQATLKNNPLLEKIAEKTNLKDFRNPNFKDMLMKVEVKNGFVSVRPFDVKVGDYLVNVSGSNSLEGHLNYILKMDVPTGKAGIQFASRFASLTGRPLEGVDRAKIDFALGGSYQKPQVRFLASTTANQLKNTVVKEVIRKPLEKAREKAMVRADSLRRRAGQQTKNEITQQGMKLLEKLTKSPKDS
ncbi:AsmA-like C-terminal region-containing protein [Larkinella soli]|uniref:AsmA-like C-terminal region-containing protein n=1 Tax=Larkinella soli TaxID=1770527 RepID=UPI000FFC879B|nr:AsmA-like C-terminal region-containing protein [Larkinella soli]